MDNNTEFLSLARQSSLEGNLSLAIQNYFSYFHNAPKISWDQVNVEEFVDLICDLKIFLRIPPVAEELWNTIKEATNLFPDNWRLMDLSADIYYQFECHEEFITSAFSAFEIAQKNNVSCLSLERKILDIMWFKVPRWHFRMLNGKLRNTAYKKAIHKALDEEFTSALDIGAGCGLLSLYLGTHRSKPTITLFESDKTFYDLAVLNLKKYCPEIVLDSYQSNSNDIERTKFKSNLLVTEIFDVAVFGEGILSTLLHSFNWHIDTSNYRIIPARVNIFVTGITCKNLDRQFRLQNKISSLLIDENILVTKNIEGDPYDAENILGHKFQALTETTELMKLYFHEKETLEFIYGNNWSKEINLKGIGSGFIDCLVVWFDLHLDNETMISTNPLHNQNEPCWEQAIFHCRTPLEISENKNITLSVKIQDEHLLFEKIDESLQTIPHFILDGICLQFLNDVEWTKFLISLSEMITENEQLTILDFSCFPLLGLLLAKKGHKVIHIDQSSENNDLVDYLVKKNGINPLFFQAVDRHVFAPYVLREDKIDYVFFEPCDSGGRLNSSPSDNIIFKKFKFNGFFTDIYVHFKLIYSAYLNYCNKVSVENVQPFENLANNINLFTGTEHPCLPHDFPHEDITNDQKWNVKENPQKVFSLRSLKDGKVNAILTWFTIVGKGGIQYCTRESTYFNLNALLIPERRVEKSETLIACCQYEKGGFFKIQICEEKELARGFSVEEKHSLPLKNFFAAYHNEYLESEHDSALNND
ncbi:protein arginine N-methyltransferase 9-like [Coccinella septempunctata]|uniref:protein arginine N-methyltransferase 9-like n=1 Tax=Coccinella septempunctata TaxID=41139 RepID=UPI001D075E10|nr:protein arginine N-methyltransferase 9-like [Coccinella septempunctata]